MLDELRQEATGWCQGRNWLVRVPLLAACIYIIVRHMCDQDYSSILAPLNLGIHELGHMVFAVLGQWPGVAGGTLLQLAVPVIGFFNFYAQRDFFAISLMFGWLSVNFFEVARYAGDARSMLLPLVSVGGQETVIHDWNYMLGGLGVLPWDTSIAGVIRVCAVLLAVCGIITGSWLLWQMKRGTFAMEGKQ